MIEKVANLQKIRGTFGENNYNWAAWLVACSERISNTRL